MHATRPPARKPPCSPRSRSWKRTARAWIERRSTSFPTYSNAAAHVRDAYLTYARTALPAPVSGFVAKRAVQLGQRVRPGSPLMAIVPLDQVWVDANFKEPQLAEMRGVSRSRSPPTSTVAGRCTTARWLALAPVERPTGPHVDQSGETRLHQIGC